MGSVSGKHLVYVVSIYCFKHKKKKDNLDVVNICLCKMAFWFFML